METAYREMQFATMQKHILDAKDALQRALDGIEREDAPYVMLQAEHARKQSQLASFHADHVLMLSEQEDTVLLEVPPDGSTDTSNQTSRQSGQVMR